MADYSIGSLADLISGTKTANKPDVVEQAFIQPQVTIPNVSKHKKGKKRKSQSSEELEGVIQRKVKKKKKHHADEPEDSLHQETTGNVVKRIKTQERNRKFKKAGDNKFPSKNIRQDGTKTNLQEAKRIPRNEEEELRTLFVGNVPITIKKTQLTKLFSKYGKVESVRLRCAAPDDPKVSKRVAVIKHMLHPKRQTLHSYVRFKTKEDAFKAVELNGTKYKGHYLRVNSSCRSNLGDERTSLFVGNLSFDIEEDDLWEAFECCGKIKSVRVVRDPVQGVGKGFGYVNFESSDSVELALENNTFTIKNRQVVLKRYWRKEKPSEEWKGRVQRSKKLGVPKPPLKDGYERRVAGKSMAVKSSVLVPVGKKGKTKKKKLNKDMLKKIKLNLMVAPRQEATATK